MQEALVQQGGFAVLAGCAIWAVVAIAKIGLAHMTKSHERETATLQLLAQDRAEVLKLAIDTLLEVRAALTGLQDEVAGLSGRMPRQ
jgi:hypothetical protein